jgi:hypothetical protein
LADFYRKTESNGAVMAESKTAYRGLKRLGLVLLWGLVMVLAGCKTVYENIPATTSVIYAAVFTVDVLLLFDISVIYKNMEGSDITVPITADTISWKHQLDDVLLPFTAAMEFKFEKKEDFNPMDKDSYDLGFSYAIYYKRTTDSVWSGNSYLPSTSHLSNKEIEDYRNAFVQISPIWTQNITE